MKELIRKELKEEFGLTEEDKAIIKLEEELIETIIRIREEKGLTQEELARLSHVQQPAIARLEQAVHYLRVDSLLKILVPMSYKLQIVPLKT